MPPANPFPRQAATFSIIAPFAAILIGIVLQPVVHGTRTAMIVLGLTSTLLIFAGLIFGIVALIATRQHGREGIFGRALAGTIINGLFVLLIPIAVLLPIVLAITHGHLTTTTQGELDKATRKLTAAPDGAQRFYALDGAAKQSFEAGQIEDARKYATELLALAPKFQGDWNYGNAIQDGNLVLGRIALHEGQTDEAKQYLLKSGQTPGSPQLNSFGPNMSLAKDLVEKGERDTVLQYFQLCRKFWKMDYGKLDEWTQAVQAGKVPDFGANLLY